MQKCETLAQGVVTLLVPSVCYTCLSVVHMSLNIPHTVQVCPLVSAGCFPCVPPLVSVFPLSLFDRD